MPDDADRAPAGLTLSAAEEAALRLLQVLAALDYRFTTPTPETHRRVVARESMKVARNLRDVFGWSLPFSRELIGDELTGLAERAGFLRATAEGYESSVRVSCVHDRLFLHSDYPTASDDSVFLGPDSIRFADFLLAELSEVEEGARLVDIGAGAGVGGIIAGRALSSPRVELVDINPVALSRARVNAAHAGVAVETYESDGMSAVAPGFDIAIANPPFIIDEGGPAYRAGGDMHGAALSRDWTMAAAAGLAPGGRVILYSGVAIVDGRDALRALLERELPGIGCTLRYRELDPDIFGDQLDHPGYEDVERIAAIGAVVTKA